MTALLRPMSLGEILDRTFQIYRSRFLVFLGIAVIPVTAKMTLILFGFLIDEVTRQTTLTYAVKRGLQGDVQWFASRFAGGFAIYLIWPVFAILVAQIFVHDKLDIRAAFHDCLVRWRSWMLMGGVLWLIESELPRQLRASPFLLNAWLSMPLWLSSILTSLEGFALIAPLCLSVPTWSLEGVSVSGAIARSWSLSKRAYGRLFLAWLLADVIRGSIGLTIGAILLFAFRLISGNEWHPSSPGYVTFAWSIPAYTSSILVAPLIPIAITLIYYDQRIRLEGFDVETMMDAAGMNASLPTQTPEVVAGAPLEEAQG